MANEIQEIKFNRIANGFADKVSNQIEGFSQSISSQEAKRLTLSLCVAANENLIEKGMTWDDVNANKFVIDAVSAVALGLDASNREVYAVPYKNKNGLIDLEVQRSAWGWRKIVMQYSIGRKINDMKAFAVKEGDTFTVRHTPLNDEWTYEENLFGSGDIKGYVTIIIYEDGTSNVMTHSLDVIKKRRDASKAPNSPAWTKWPVEMAIAKAIRRHCKTIAFALPNDMERAWSDMNAAESPELQAKAEIQESANKIPLTMEDQPEEVNVITDSDGEVIEPSADDVPQF